MGANGGAENSGGVGGGGGGFVSGGSVENVNRLPQPQKTSKEKKTENSKASNFKENELKPKRTNDQSSKRKTSGSETDGEGEEEEGEEEEDGGGGRGVIPAGRTPGLGPEIITVQIPALVQYTDGLYTTTVERQNQSEDGLRMPQGFWREKLIARLKAKRTLAG